jgi:hypothetical protein
VLHGPGIAQLDASLSKSTALGDRSSLQFRAECFNFVNHPNFDVPNGVFGTPAFGQIFSTVGKTLGFGTSRQIQLSLRLRF